MVYGNPHAMVARLPETVCICPRLAGMWRAHQVAIVPLSQLTMALAGRRLPNSAATTCGFIGVVFAVACFSISLFQSFMPDCACDRKLFLLLLFKYGNKA